MSRIGKMPVEIPPGVEVDVSEANVAVKGPKGELAVPFRADSVGVVVEGGSTLNVGRKSEEKSVRALHGLTRSLIANAVTGVTQGFSKRLEIHGVGFRVDAQGRKLTLHIGYSHPVVYEAPVGIDLQVEDAPGFQGLITVSGIDKQKVGQVAADIRKSRRPDPYKGKGIRYVGETIHLKAGKAAVT